MNQRTQGKAYFAVKRKPVTPQCAPELIAIVQSYDDGIVQVRLRNERAQAQLYFLSTHYTE